MVASSRRLRLEIGLAAVSAVVCIATLLWRDWIEIAFKVDPDGGDGSLEWVLVAASATAATVALLLAQADARRIQAASDASR